MKKILAFLVLLLFANYSEAKIIILERRLDANSLVYVSAKVWGNADGTVKEFVIRDNAALVKIAGIGNKSVSGMARNADRIIIYLKEDGTVDRIDYQVNSRATTEGVERTIKSSEDLTSPQRSDVEVVRADVQSL